MRVRMRMRMRMRRSSGVVRPVVRPRRAVGTRRGIRGAIAPRVGAVLVRVTVGREVAQRRHQRLQLGDTHGRVSHPAQLCLTLQHLRRGASGVCAAAQELALALHFLLRRGMPTHACMRRVNTRTPRPRPHSGRAHTGTTHTGTTQHTQHTHARNEGFRNT